MASTAIPAAFPTEPAAAAAHAVSGKASPTDAAAETVLWAVPVVVLGLTLAVQAWGLVALTMAALVMVPVIFVLLLWVTLP